MLHPRGVSSEVQPRGRAGVGSWLCASTEHTRRSRCEVDRSTHGNIYAFYRGASPSVFDIYRYDTGIWGFIDFFRVVLVNGMRKWYASY